MSSLKTKGLKTKKQGEFDLHWQGTLSDYVMAIAWSPDGKTLATSSAAGEVVLYQETKTFQAMPFQGVPLQVMNGDSVDCLAFSHDGQFLAAGGQNGQVHIWQVQSNLPELIAPKLVATVGKTAAWVDRMAWSPTQNLLAFSLGKYVQVWDAKLGDVATTLNFDTSSALDLAWHPDGQRLSVSGYQGVKIWTAEDWDDDPYFLTIPSASVAIAWSPDGKYIASGNLDRTMTVLEWENPHPWVMRGFPGKIRQLAWSNVMTKAGASLLASASAEGIVVWEKQEDLSLGWEGRVLAGHEGTVQSIQFQPDALLFASAAADGRVCLWQKAQHLAQVLNGAPNGFSCLAWHPKGHQLAVGGQNGELLIWAKVLRGKGFGQREKT
ncbi:MAG: WD40 repeat domain-containing protein [Timaviella obliquedivisa GSE-PSE-MK23-08B]|jgi:WD40 repeat protein|nr:WD40 repeat domain-containing protein [Timaviella obliquedivisa GSE-PSE-MK23-08B]